jgi:aspartate kinase
MLLVKKYGGSSVSSPEKILEIAKRLKHLADQGHKLIIIVSAMGDSTDDLVQLSRRITLTPVQRELDMLLSAGERISMSLLAIALNSLGCEAISFTGSQSGVFTDGSHNNARVKSIKAFRVQEELDKGRIVIIAGFQGVNPETKEITTLGRGGSDTTAVAMAAQFKADRCDILTDVRGVYSIDPRISGVSPQPLAHLDYNATLEMCYWGARVLHYRSVELAERTGVPILVHLSSEEGSGTLIQSMEEKNFKAVNYNSQVARLHFENLDLHEALATLKKSIKVGKLPTPQIIYERSQKSGVDIFVSTAPENFEGLQKNLEGKAVVDSHWATVTLSGRGLVNSEGPFEIAETLKQNEIPFEGLITTPLSFSFVIHNDKVQRAAKVLHDKFVTP